MSLLVISPIMGIINLGSGLIAYFELARDICERTLK